MSPAERKLADLEAVFTALAHEQRRHILLTLKFRGGEMTAGDIARRFACSWPTTTGHLQVLEKAGLVVSERRGRERVYRLDADRLRAVAGEWLAWFAPSSEAGTGVNAPKPAPTSPPRAWRRAATRRDRPARSGQ